jgi:hypothetical protein
MRDCIFLCSIEGVGEGEANAWCVIVLMLGKQRFGVSGRSKAIIYKVPDRLGLSMLVLFQITTFCCVLTLSIEALADKGVDVAAELSPPAASRKKEAKLSKGGALRV